MKNIAEQVYDHIVQHNTGTQFTSGETANKLGMHVNPVSAAFHHLEKKGVLHAIGKRKHAFIYEYVSHEPVRFNKPYAGKCSHFRRLGDAHPKRDLPKMEGEHHQMIINFPQEQLNRLHLVSINKKPSLSERLLDLAVEVEQLESRLKKLEAGLPLELQVETRR